MAVKDKLISNEVLKAVNDNMQGQVTDLKSAFIAESTQFEDYGTGLLSRGQFQRGLYNPTNNSYALQYTYRIGARVQIVFPYAVTLTIKSGFRFLPYRYENGAWVQKGWATGTYSIPANDPFYCQIARTTDDTSENANIEEFLKAVVVSGNAIQKQIDEIKTVVDTIKPFVRDLNTDEPEAVEVENGAWGVISGALDDNQSSTIRIRGKYVYKVSPGMKIIFRSDNVQCYVAELSDLSNGTITANSGWMDNRLSKIESVYTTTGNGYVYINYRFSDNSAITADDYTGYTYVVVSGFAYNIPEKAVHVYHFGGAGNDWCFVRTPANYNPKRDKPYPFVICNHGNGWTMDGTLITSNWTNITMYWSESETGWIAGRMIDTDDESLWGSNPTIEALLAAGYVVCGCENYADAQYGNTPCRNACVDFFYHMISRYNVEKRCYMIGASNGAMTSLNAAYILQGAVKAMVLQYPLTCLVDQYFSNTSQQAGIKTAYGIPTADVGSEDTEENRTKLTKYVATHDPLTVDVVDGKKIGSFPPVKLYYSPDDTVTRASVNALVMYDLLDASNKVVEKVQCSGAHGDQSHFAPSDYVAWFNAH